MSFVKISGTKKIREEKIDTMIGLSKRVTLSMAVPEDALVSHLCVDELAKTIVIDDEVICVYCTRDKPYTKKPPHKRWQDKAVSVIIL